MQTSVEKRLESLQMPAPRLASDYLDERELSAKFKKVKKKVTYSYYLAGNLVHETFC